jgi:hypothetical protein
MQPMTPLERRAPGSNDDDAQRQTRPSTDLTANQLGRT